MADSWIGPDAASGRVSRADREAPAGATSRGAAAGAPAAPNGQRRIRGSGDGDDVDDDRRDAGAGQAAATGRCRRRPRPGGGLDRIPRVRRAEEPEGRRGVERARRRDRARQRPAAGLRVSLLGRQRGRRRHADTRHGDHRRDDGRGAAPWVHRACFVLEVTLEARRGPSRKAQSKPVLAGRQGCPQLRRGQALAVAPSSAGASSAVTSTDLRVELRTRRGSTARPPPRTRSGAPPRRGRSTVPSVSTTFALPSTTASALRRATSPTIAGIWPLLVDAPGRTRSGPCRTARRPARGTR